MFVEQFLRRIKILRHIAVVPHVYLVRINTDLYRIAAGIVFVDDCVKHNFPERISAEHEPFNPLFTFT
jgi:hypothetical protein